MSFPKRAQAALEEVGAGDLPGVLALGVECEGAKFHSPNPLILHEVSLSPSGLGDTALLCATCRDNLSVFHHLLVTNEGELPWAVRREFGNIIRALGMQGWDADHSPHDDEVDAGA